MPSHPTPANAEMSTETLLAIGTLTTALRQLDIPIVKVMTGPIGATKNTGRPRHNPDIDAPPRSIDDLWISEGHQVNRPEASAKTELQVLHGDRVYRFYDQAAAVRLAFLAPTVCRSTIGGRKEAPVAEGEVGNDLVIRLSSSSLARSFCGATGVREASLISLANSIIREDWKPRNTAFSGRLKNERFWNCVIQVFIFHRLMYARFKKFYFAALGQELVLSMLREGRCRTVLVEEYLSSLICIIRGTAENEAQERILSLDNEEKAQMWRSRRIFYKDDSDPVLNAQQAIARMCGPTNRESEQDMIASEALKLLQHEMRAYLVSHQEEAQRRHDDASMHRASATVFFSRSEGGGGAELHFMVGLYRLANGQSSTLSDVWGNVSEHLSVEELIDTVKQEPARRKEIEDAGLWFTSELDKRNMSYPFICIYPEREAKGRTFMLLTYAEQQGGYNAATTLSGFLRSRFDTREVYRGFETRAWLGRIRRDIMAQLDSHVLWLDSAVSTDPLPHDYCLRVFEPFNEVFSEFTKAMLVRTFSPRRVHVCTSRPKGYLSRLAFQETVFNHLSCEVTSREVMPVRKYPDLFEFATHSENLPAVRTVDILPDIIDSLRQNRRILLKAPTGSGKTMLSACAFNSVIQFPTIAALLIFKENLTAMGQPFNVWYSGEKRIDEWDPQTGEPRTILCTAFFVPQLMRQYPNMVAVLDEADIKGEYNLINLMQSKVHGWWTLVTSATLSELQGEEYTPVIELAGGTNFPVTDDECSYEDMLTSITDERAPKALIIVHSEPLAQRIADHVSASGRKGLALTGRQRQDPLFMERVNVADVIVSTNAIRTSVTLPVIVVFDCQLMYESVHFPTAGIDSLMLFTVSESMKLQARGRVGRTAPGTYLQVRGAPGEPQPYSPRLLGRSDTIAALLAKIPLREFAREFNLGALLVEAFHLEQARRQGVKRGVGRPFWIDILQHFANNGLYRLIQVVGFEECNIASRTRSLETDIEVAQPYRDFSRDAPLNYDVAVDTLLKTCEKFRWFATEIGNIRRWQSRLEEETLTWTEENQRAVGFALWRQVAKVQNQQCVGVFRDFSCKVPAKWKGAEGSHYVAMGVSLFNNEVTCRGLLPVSDTAVAWLRTVLAEKVDLSLASEEPSLEIPQLTWDVKLTNNGSQRRRVSLHYDQYTRNTVFHPGDENRILDTMIKLNDEKREGPVTLTTRGSPMSSTASFPVLNSFGLAAHLRAREVTGEQLRGASSFGDDDAVAGSEKACKTVIVTREALGLQTKWSDTVMHHVRKQGELIAVRGLGVYTERLIDVNSFTEVNSLKPAGILRVFHAKHASQVISPKRVFRADLLSFEDQIARRHPEWAELLNSEVEEEILRHARRQTAPRRILGNMFKQELTPRSKIALGDAERLFLHLEAAMLTVYPSTRGDPDRVIDPAEDVLGGPVVGFETATRLAELLQGEDCYFKLRGPPLRFSSMEFASAAAARVCHLRNIPYNKSDMYSAFAALGWGGGSRHEDPISEPQDSYIPFPEQDDADYDDALGWD